MEKLDSFGKILLATGNINYLAAAIHGLNEQMRFIPDSDGVHKPGIEKRDNDLADALAHLTQAMEILGNSLEEPCAIDVYVTTPSFQVIMHGHDDIEGDFDDL